MMKRWLDIGCSEGSFNISGGLRMLILMLFRSVEYQHVTVGS